MISNSASALSPEELSHTLDGLSMLEDWIKAVRATAHALAEQGTQSPATSWSKKLAIGNGPLTTKKLFLI
jgi:hypothetical protein